jgi:hypothetical protein
MSFYFLSFEIRYLLIFRYSGAYVHRDFFYKYFYLSKKIFLDMFNNSGTDWSYLYYFFEIK